MIRIDMLIKEKYDISREHSKELITNGKVKVNNKIIYKPGLKIDKDSTIELLEDAKIKYVGRGGFKLEGAFEKFNIDVTDKVCIDVGASTGGFTDCMLQNGALKVYAIDVGSNQLVQQLKDNDRVISMENTNIKDIKKSDINDNISFASIDVSFISLTKVLNNVMDIIEQGADIVALIKPQFEAGKDNISKNGIIKNPKLHKKILKDICNFSQDIGFKVLDLHFSKIKGSDGNIEYLIHLKKETIDDKEDFSNTIDSIVLQAYKFL